MNILTPPYSKLLLILFAVSWIGVSQSPGKTTDRPNIIFILADDLGYADIEPFGQKTIETPNLSRMADEGMSMTQHYAGGPVCSPSRSSLMTGQHTGNTPVRGNLRDLNVGVQPLTHSVMTIAEMLKADSNYTTALYGRWHLGGIFSDSQPHQRGFDEFFGALSKYYKPNDTYFRPDLYRNGESFFIEENNNGVKGKHREDIVTDEALKFLERQSASDSPFFLYVAYSFPHAPVQGVPGEDQYNGRDWPQKEIDFAHNISRLDRYVGQFMDQLKKLGMDEDTLVIFTSDNGPHLEDGHDPDFFDSNGLLKGYKRDLYEGGIRMPFIARWPGQVEAGSESDHVSAFWDLMPTVADLAGIEAPEQTDGISYAPTLLGEQQQAHEYLYWEFRERTPRQAVRLGKWKGIYFIEHDRFELYDLSKDIGEENNLASKRPKLVAKLRSIMEEAHTYNRNYPITNSEKFVQVSSRNPRYFQYEDGTPFIPIGTSISWSRTTEDPQEALEQFRVYFKDFAENGGNLVRIWLSAPVFEVEHQQANGYDYQKKLELLDPLVDLAAKHGIKIKFCMENFRQLLNRPAPFEGSVPFDKPIYHVDNGGPFTHIDQFHTTREGHDLYLDKLKFFSNQYGDNPSIFGWELWNEVNANRVSDKQILLDWTKRMLPEAKKIFPRHLIMQTLGSYDSMTKRANYKTYSELPGNEVAQVHRYLDPGANWHVCKGPMDILAAEAIRDLLAFDAEKPVILSENGAVNAGHSGPSDLYDIDSEGVLLHDGIFAPFFSGSAGSGQFWHWHHYVEKHDLWWHFGRFRNAIKGINPLRENFRPVYRESQQTRSYILNGDRTLIAWIRDEASDWKSELIDGQEAKPIKGIEAGGRVLPLPGHVKSVDCYLPWEDKWITASRKNGKIVLPSFTRSIVVRANLVQPLETAEVKTDNF